MKDDDWGLAWFLEVHHQAAISRAFLTGLGGGALRFRTPGCVPASASPDTDPDPTMTPVDGRLRKCEEALQAQGLAARTTEDALMRPFPLFCQPI